MQLRLDRRETLVGEKLEWFRLFLLVEEIRRGRGRILMLCVVGHLRVEMHR